MMKPPFLVASFSVRSALRAAGAGLGLLGLGLGLGLGASPQWSGAAPSAPLPPTAGAPVGFEQPFVALARKVMPAVVNLNTWKRPVRPHGGMPRWGLPLLPPFGAPGGEGGPGEAAPPEEEGFGAGPGGGARPYALGTGFLIDAAEGLLLTNHHVVAGSDEVRVTFTEGEDEKPLKARIVGADPDLDIALLKLEGAVPASARPLVLGDSDRLQVGEYVAAAGNPFGQGHSFTHGIVSAKDRVAPQLPLTRYLQTDAPINPGNSGGPLLNLAGEVVGINNAIDARAQGIGFAIPINAVKGVLAQLKRDGKVSRGYLGVSVTSIDPSLAAQLPEVRDGRGALVADVAPGTPAARAGLRRWDVILGVDGKEITSPSALTQAVAGREPGESIALDVLRQGRRLKLSFKTAERPQAKLRE